MSERWQGAFLVVVMVVVLGTVGQALAGDWGDALDGATIAALMLWVVSLSRQVSDLRAGRRSR